LSQISRTLSQGWNECADGETRNVCIQHGEHEVDALEGGCNLGELCAEEGTRKARPRHQSDSRTSKRKRIPNARLQSVRCVSVFLQSVPLAVVVAVTVAMANVCMRLLDTDCVYATARYKLCRLDIRFMHSSG
jgi:hypothetical protein